VCHCTHFNRRLPAVLAATKWIRRFPVAVSVAVCCVAVAVTLQAIGSFVSAALGTAMQRHHAEVPVHPSTSTFSQSPSVDINLFSSRFQMALPRASVISIGRESKSVVLRAAPRVASADAASSLPGAVRDVHGGTSALLSRDQVDDITPLLSANVGKARVSRATSGLTQEVKRHVREAKGACVDEEEDLEAAEEMKEGILDDGNGLADVPRVVCCGRRWGVLASAFARTILGLGQIGLFVCVPCVVLIVVVSSTARFTAVESYLLPSTLTEVFAACGLVSIIAHFAWIEGERFVVVRFAFGCFCVVVVSLGAKLLVLGFSGVFSGRSFSETALAISAATVKPDWLIVWLSLLLMMYFDGIAIVVLSYRSRNIPRSPLRVLRKAPKANVAGLAGMVVLAVYIFAVFGLFFSIHTSLNRGLVFLGSLLFVKNGGEYLLKRAILHLKFPIGMSAFCLFGFELATSTLSRVLLLNIGDSKSVLLASGVSTVMEMGVRFAYLLRYRAMLDAGTATVAYRDLLAVNLSGDSIVEYVSFLTAGALQYFVGVKHAAAFPLLASAGLNTAISIGFVVSVQVLSEIPVDLVCQYFELRLGLPLHKFAEWMPLSLRIATMFVCSMCAMLMLMVCRR